MSTAHSLYLVTAPQYQLHGLQPNQQTKQDTKGWLHIQRALLRLALSAFTQNNGGEAVLMTTHVLCRALISTARALNDSTASAAYALALLRTYERNVAFMFG